jgi:2-C-methyl-D-erythritol 4-phosphate cytidylyltransferase
VNILLLMMGGTGVRFGADIPKQYILVERKPVFSYIMSKYNSIEEIDKIVIVSHEAWIEYVEEWATKLGIGKLHKIVAGGSTRSESVKNGLEAASDIASERDVILIHDATHPYVDIDGTLEVIEEVKRVGGATLGAAQYDTMYRMDGDSMIAEVIPREEIVSGASPEAFRFKTLYDIYRAAPLSELERMTSAGAIALAHDIPMSVVITNIINLKITYERDMEAFERLFDGYFF